MVVAKPAPERMKDWELTDAAEQLDSFDLDFKQLANEIRHQSRTTELALELAERLPKYIKYLRDIDPETCVKATELCRHLSVKVIE